MSCCEGCSAGVGCETIGDVYGDCDSFQVIVSADPVNAIRTRLSGEFLATDFAVQSCQSLSPEERAAWDVKYDSWREHLKIEPGIWNANALFRAACAMGKDLDGWRAYMRHKCQLAGPENVVNAEHGTEFKWLAVAAVVVAVAYVAGPMLRRM